MLSFSSLFLLLSLLPISTSHTFLKILPESSKPKPLITGDDPVLPHCEAWRLSVETNNAGHWKKIPTQCQDPLLDYINGQQFIIDSKVIARQAYSYAEAIKVAEDGMDAWIFDVDETLIIRNFTAKKYGLEVSEHVNSVKAPLPWSRWFYKKLQGMGFQLILLTGRKEKHRDHTEQSLLAAGYQSWKMLILREPKDENKTALIYKSERRAELEAAGYRIHGSTGDQWSDLLGSPQAKRSFKLPNPMYHIA